MRLTMRIVPVLVFISLSIAFNRSALGYEDINEVDLLQEILEVVTITNAEVAALEAKLDDTDSELAATKAAIDTLPRPVIVESRFTTSENALNGVNLDFEAGLSTLLVKRYTVILNVGNLAFHSSPGTTRIRVISMVKNPDGTFQGAPVFDADVVSLASPPFHGAAVGPYAGTNSFIWIERGDDGLGEVDVTVNAFIEVGD